MEHHISPAAFNGRSDSVYLPRAFLMVANMDGLGGKRITF